MDSFVAAALFLLFPLPTQPLTRGGTLSLDEFKKTIQARVSAYRSIQYRTKVKIDIRTERLTMTGTTEQTYETLRKGDKVLFRAETIVDHTRKENGEDVFLQARTLELCDGEYNYVFIRNMDERKAYRRKTDPNSNYNSFNPMAEFARMERGSILRMLPDEMVNGRLAYVLEATLRPNTPEERASDVPRTVYYYDRATGLIVKALAYDRKGRIASTTITDSIRINGDIPPDQFVFKVPEGVKIEEMPADWVPGK